MRRPKRMSMESLLARIQGIEEHQCGWSPFPSRKAIFATHRLTTGYALTEPMPDGWRCCEYPGVLFNDETGLPKNSPEDYMVISLDNAQDPILALILEDALDRFRSFNREKPRELAAALTHYVDRLLIPDQVDERLYSASWRRFFIENLGRVVPIGKIARRRNGVCLPVAALLKYLGDRLGINLVLQFGVVCEDFAEPHSWTYLEADRVEWIFDAARQVIDVPTPEIYEKGP